MVRVYQRRDTHSLNKSFETAETSDSLYSEDAMFHSKQPVVIALGLGEKESLDTAKTSDSLYSADLFPNSAASLKFNSDEEDLDDISSGTALCDTVVTAGIVSGSQWKEDKQPFDEEAILEEGAGESGRYPDESLDEVIEITMIADKAGKHTDNFKAAACVKERKRRRMALLAILCCFLLIVAVAIGLLVGTSRNNKQNGDASAVSGLQSPPPEDPIGEEDEPDREEDDEELKEKLVGVPTLFTSPPSMEPTTMTPSDLPTASPTTPEPTSNPTSSPSSQPTPCMNQISVDQSCYVQGQAVVTIDFSQCNPQTNDWIGIYVDGANPQALGDNYVNWSWACGSQGCSGTAKGNTFTFNSADFARRSFRAYLIRDSQNGDAPYGSIVTSDVFRVARNCPA